MSLRLQIILAALTLVTLAMVINLVRKNKLELKYSLTWIFVGIGILILTIWPDLIFKVTHLLGIVDAMNTVFFVGSIFQLIIIFSLTVALSRQSNKLKQLTQEVALRDVEKRKQS